MENSENVDRAKLILRVKERILKYENAVNDLIVENRKLREALWELAEDVKEKLLDHGYDVEDVYVEEDENFPKHYIVIKVNYEGSALELEVAMMYITLLLVNYYGLVFLPYFRIELI